MNDICGRSSGIDETNRIRALLLRAVASEMLAFGDDKAGPAASPEFLSLATRLLLDIAAELDVATPLAHDMAPRFRAAFQGLGNDATSNDLDVRLAHYRDAAQKIEASCPAGEATTPLRNLLAELTFDLSTRDDPGLDRQDIETVLDQVIVPERDFVSSLLAAPSIPSKAPDDLSQEPLPPGFQDLDNITRYLRNLRPAENGIEAKDIRLIPGGRSKKTYRLTVAHSASLPSHIIVRQDMKLKYADRTVVTEFAPLLALAAAGLPTPAPLHLEAKETDLGPPFMLMARMPGEPAGGYYDPIMPFPQAMSDLSRTLAALHAIDTDRLPSSDDAGLGEIRSMRSEVRRHWDTWRANSTRLSAFIDYAFSIAYRSAATEIARPVLVHGDCGVHNILIDEGRLSGLLDWEFLHLGEPAEDLGIAFAYCPSRAEWDEFIQTYEAHGGTHVDHDQVRVGALLHFLKGAALAAVSGRNFAEGGTDDFVKGANSFTSIRRIEERLADILG